MLADFSPCVVHLNSVGSAKVEIAVSPFAHLPSADFENSLNMNRYEVLGMELRHFSKQQMTECCHGALSLCQTSKRMGGDGNLMLWWCQGLWVLIAFKGQYLFICLLAKLAWFECATHLKVTAVTSHSDHHESE